MDPMQQRIAGRRLNFTHKMPAGDSKWPLASEPRYESVPGVRT